MRERSEGPASVEAGGTWEVGAMEREREEAAAGLEPVDLDAFRAVLAMARVEPVEGARLQALFEGLGVRIGHLVAQQIREGQPAQVEELVASTFRTPEVVELLSATVLAFEGAGKIAAKGGASGSALQPGRPGRRRKRGEPPPPCGTPGCGRPSRTRGFCQTHYVQWLRANRADPA